MATITRQKLIEWLATIDVKGRTLDIGGKVWSIKGRVKSFEGIYKTLQEDTFDLNECCWGYLKANDYDNIFCTEVMLFIYNPKEALNNLYFILKKGGNLYITFHFSHPLAKSHDYLRYTKKGAIRLLQEVGFTVEDIQEPIEGYYLFKCIK